MESGVATVVPGVRADPRQGVDVKPVAVPLARGVVTERTRTRRAQVRVLAQHRAGLGVKAELLEVLVRPPLPDDVPVEVDLDDAIVEQRVVADPRIHDVLVNEDQSIAAIRERRLAWHEITDGVTLALKVVVLTRQPARRAARV